MSVEIKCDRCGKPLEPRYDGGPYTSRVSKNNFEVLRDGKLELYDLCDNCLRKFDIFMGGKMPDPRLHGELAYLELPDPKVCVCEKKLLAGRESEIHISANLEPLSKLIEEYGVEYTPLSSVKQVILGVKLQ